MNFWALLVCLTWIRVGKAVLQYRRLFRLFPKTWKRDASG